MTIDTHNERQPEQHDPSEHRWKKPAAIGAVLVVLSALAFGIGEAVSGGTETQASGPSPSASAPVVPGTSEQPSASATTPASGETATIPVEDKYPDLYNLKLTSPSISAKEADAMSSEALSEALAVKVSDVDKSQFAESYAATVTDRLNTRMNLGLVPENCGPSSDPETYKKEVASKYAGLTSKAIFGPNENFAPAFMERVVGQWCTQENAKQLGAWKTDKSSEAGSTLVPSTANAQQIGDGIYKGSFTVRDTIRPPQGMSDMNLPQLKPYDVVETFTYTVSEAGGKWVTRDLTVTDPQFVEEVQ